MADPAALDPAALDPASADSAFHDPALAAWYDALNPWGPGDDFYLELVMAAGAVLDVGCGTGALLRRAREAGHRGRLCGLDPAAAMLDRARARSDVEWALGPASAAPWRAEFDLAVMTGHAFQALLTDAELRASLAAVRAALRPGGRFAFETRNPAARPWERWTPDRAGRVTGPSGAAVQVAHRVLVPVRDGLVRFTETYTGADLPAPRVSRSTLRFLDVPALDALLGGAGLAVEERYGDWDRSPCTAAAPEIITLARRAA